MLTERLKLLRTEGNLTQKEFASKFNMSDARYNQYETGKREPDYQTLQIFADYFNVSIDYLLGRTDIRNHLPVMDDEFVDEQLKELLSDPELRVAFMDFDKWDEADKKELIGYLRAKNLARKENKK